jgi:biopolymer transport protein ExbD
MKVGGKGPSSEINITPLVDVVLVLLIIFMVISPMLTKHIPIEVPEESEAQPDTDTIKDQVILRLRASGEIVLNKDTVPLEGLDERIFDLMKGRAQKVIFFDAEDNVPYTNVVSVMDLCKSAGVETIGIVTVDLEAAESGGVQEGALPPAPSE